MYIIIYRFFHLFYTVVFSVAYFLFKLYIYIYNDTAFIMILAYFIFFIIIIIIIIMAEMAVV